MAATYPNEGVRLTRQAMKRRGMTIDQLRYEIRRPEGKPLGTGVLPRIFAGQRKPSLPVAVEIERVLGVPCPMWMEVALPEVDDDEEIEPEEKSA